MPEAFERCRASGGRIRTISGPSEQFGLVKGEYIHICITKSGKVVRGEKKTKKQPENT